MINFMRLRLFAISTFCLFLLGCNAAPKTGDPAHTPAKTDAAHAPAASPPATTTSTGQPTAGAGGAESLQSLAARIVPEGMRLEHPIVELEFGGQAGSRVVLYNEAEYRPFTGWVFVPRGDDYMKLALPATELPVSTKVKAVFAANADGDPETELLILCEHISGVGKSPANTTPFCNTYVYDLAGDQIRRLEQVETALEPVDENCSVNGIRGKLSRLGY
jgi:hypothetical protein